MARPAGLPRPGGAVRRRRRCAPRRVRWIDRLGPAARRDRRDRRRAVDGRRRVLPGPRPGRSADGVAHRVRRLAGGRARHGLPAADDALRDRPRRADVRDGLRRGLRGLPPQPRARRHRAARRRADREHVGHPHRPLLPAPPLRRRGHAALAARRPRGPAGRLAAAQGQRDPRGAHGDHADGDHLGWSGHRPGLAADGGRRGRTADRCVALDGRRLDRRAGPVRQRLWQPHESPVADQRQ